MMLTRKIRLPVLAVALLGIAACREEAPAPDRYPVIPFPRGVEAKGGAFLLDGNTRIRLEPPDDVELQAVVGPWADSIRAVTTLPLPFATGGSGGSDNEILIRLKGAADGTVSSTIPAGSGLPGTEAESYELEVKRDGVILEAPAYPGIFYGLETLAQLGPYRPGPPEERRSLPAADIDDGPRFPYRGMHLDVGRHFFPVSFIKRYLDLLASYRMNVFHWHLTEDQGWRIEIQGWPRLTEVGSCRRETILERNFDPYVGDGIPYCGFYTQDEIREVVQYAGERFITIIPEIEMPGHSVAALAAYPELGCTPGPFEVSTQWGVTRDIYCPKEETFSFLEDVLTQVMDLFPGTYIHIGGDEAPKDAWEESEMAQEVIRREGLADEAELQSWFIRRIEAFLNTRGRRLVGWDEILEGGLAPNATVMSWRGIAGGIEAARQGHDVIMTPNSHLYLDYYQGDTIQEPLAIGGFSPLERVYSYDPVPAELTGREAQHVLGAQGNLWTEYISTTDYVEYMVLPRMLALSEVVWSPAEARDWNSFLTRLGPHLLRLEGMGVNFRIPDVFGLEGDRLVLTDTLTVELQAPPGLGAIRFTLDGTDPGPGSKAYDGPILLDLSGGEVEVAARVVLPQGRAGAVRKASMREAELSPPSALPGGNRGQGLSGVVFRGTFPSVDSIPAPGSPGSLAAPAVHAPRVTLPAGVPEDSFGLVLDGFVWIPGNGIFTFFLSSDDGSRLLLDGRTVVDNDGYHSNTERRGQAALRRGWHPIRVLYFQGGGGAEVSLEMMGPGLSRRPVPAYWFAHPGGSTTRSAAGG